MIGTSLFKHTSVCVVGNLNRDVKVNSVAASAALLQDGETSVPAITETIGGGGANSACAAAALGARVHFVGKVGADALGEQLRRVLERHGVRAHLTADPKCASGSTVALGLTSGHRHFLSFSPNNQTLRFKDLDLAALRLCKHLLRADVWFSDELLESGNERLLCEARSRGVATSVDINFDPVWSSGAARVIRQRKRMLRKILPLVDMAHGNVRELREFTDAADLNTALRRLSKWGAGSVVVHLGKRGAGFYGEGKWVIEPPSLARHTEHSTGTGDVLSICMILLAANRELTVPEKLRLSNRVVREFIEGRRELIPAL